MNARERMQAVAVWRSTWSEGVEERFMVVSWFRVAIERFEGLLEGGECRHGVPPLVGAGRLPTVLA